MTYDPKVLNATDEDRAAAFEWLRAYAVNGTQGWRHAAIMLEEIARLGDAEMMKAQQCTAERLRANAAEEQLRQRIAPEARRSDALESALKQAVQMASVATDWNLDEVEIDGVMVPTTALRDAWDDLLSLPQRHEPQK